MHSPALLVTLVLCNVLLCFRYTTVQDIVAGLRTIRISDSGTTTSIAAALVMAVSIGLHPF